MSRVINLKNKKVVVEQLEIAQRFHERVIGLMGRKKLDPGHGLWIKGFGNSIHTYFMRFPIDLAFMNKKGEVKYVSHNIRPWKMVFVPCFNHCLELPAGTLTKTETQVGDQLLVES